LASFGIRQPGVPLKQVDIQLYPDTGSASVALAQTTSDNSGVFYIDAPTLGNYRLSFATKTSTFLSNPFPVTAGDVQHEFKLDVAGAMIYFEFQVEKQVRVAEERRPVYPESMRSAGIQGLVLAQFVVDTAGHAEMWTFRLLKSTDPAFTQAVRAAIPEFRFIPAELGKRKVRQLVQMPFVFCFNQQTRRDSSSWWLPGSALGSCSSR
jgi:TonB family protein